MTATNTPQQDLAEDVPDAVVLFRPVRAEALTPFLDLDEDSDENTGIYAEALDDGSFLVFTFQPFEAFAAGPEVAHAWLAQFGEALPEVHGDPRGLLFFPDDVEPEATTYEGVIDEVGEDALWIPLQGVFDLDALHELASQLMGGGAPGGVSSFEIGRMFEGVQGHLAEALRQEKAAADAADDDEPPSKPPRND